MILYSTKNKSHRVSLKEAVVQGLAPDNGLYMPIEIPTLPKEFFDTLHEKSFADLSFEVARHLIGSDVPSPELRRIVDHTISFDAPLVEVDENVFALLHVARIIFERQMAK